MAFMTHESQDICECSDHRVAVVNGEYQKNGLTFLILCQTGSNHVNSPDMSGIVS